jgi:ribonuclease HI
MKKAEIYSDGASRGNPGMAAIGAVIKDEKGKLISSLSKAIGRATNNQAEYYALITIMKEALKLGVSDVVIHADSELIVKQLNGKWKIKNRELLKLANEARGLLKRFNSYSLDQIPRELNREADNLANNAFKSIVNSHAVD